jgi:cyclase
VRPRVIPTLLLRNGGLVKTVRFGDAKYVGDPINAVRIFNEKEVDELLFLDIGAAAQSQGPGFDVLADIASEAFMPFGYGGGIRTVEHVRRLFALGVEKVVLNRAAVEDPALVEATATLAGSSSVVVGIDVRRRLFGRPEVVTHGGTRSARVHPVAHAVEMERRGAGEILLQSVDRDGTQQGYDEALVAEVAAAVSIPVVAAGGAGSVADLAKAVQAGASAAAAGSLFVFKGRHRAVLITYPSEAELASAFRR